MFTFTIQCPPLQSSKVTFRSTTTKKEQSPTAMLVILAAYATLKRACAASHDLLYAVLVAGKMDKLQEAAGINLQWYRCRSFEVEQSKKNSMRSCCFQCIVVQYCTIDCSAEQQSTLGAAIDHIEPLETTLKTVGRRNEVSMHV
jgi:hypothetical protein